MQSYCQFGGIKYQLISVILISVLSGCWSLGRIVMFLVLVALHQTLKLVFIGGHQHKKLLNACTVNTIRNT